jgi:hypothetical protein
MMFDELENLELERQLRRKRRERKYQQQHNTVDTLPGRRKSTRTSYRLAEEFLDDMDRLPRLQCRAQRALSRREAQW